MGKEEGQFIFGKEGRLSGRRPRGRFMDGLKVDMKSVGVRGEDAEEMVRWRQLIGCGHP